MERKKKISCQRCRLRKIKCSRFYPCSNCTHVGLQCKFRQDDSRRRPVGRDYVVALEAQITHYESVLRKIKTLSAEDRSGLLEDISLGSHVHPPSLGSALSEPAIDTRGSSRMSTMSLQPSLQGSLLFHGPTSIYQEDVSLDKEQTTSVCSFQTDLREAPSLRVPHTLRIEDGILNEALSVFFLYQYPQFTFIHREAFLSDYHKNTHEGKYWSYPLLYSICALGARASLDMRIRDKGDVLSHCAETIIMTHTLSQPHITVAQALLCLAFYELGAGNHSKGWMLAGMAFRMGQDLGLQQDPKFLVSQDSTISSKRDLLVRRCIYYGFYTSDKLISLYLGRPVMLCEEEAAVDLPEPLQDEPSSRWCGLSKSTESNLGQIDETVLTSAFKGIIELSKIAEEMIYKVFSTKMIKKPRRELVLCRSSRLEELNVRLGRWHSNLPIDLTWNQWTATPGSLKPHVLILHLVYHSILISLNRHFARPTPGFDVKELSKEACISSADAIITLIRQFRAQHGLRCCPVVVVYSAVMAASGILFIQGSSTLAAEKDRRFSFILKALEECSQTHSLARESRVKLLAKVDARRNLIAENQIPETVTQRGQDLVDGYIPSTNSVDGGMFDLSAFDSGFFGSFEDIGLDLYGGAETSTANATMMQSWMSTEQLMNFQPTPNQDFPEVLQGFGL